MKISKKVVRIVIDLVLVAGVGGGAFVAYNTVQKQYSNYDAAIAERDGQITTLQSQIDEIGPLTTCYELKYDVVGGTPLDMADFKEVQIPEKATGGYVVYDAETDAPVVKVTKQIQQEKIDEETGKVAKDDDGNVLYDLVDTIENEPIDGKYYKTDLTKGTVLSGAMLLDFKMDKDTRLLDVAVDDVPIGLEIGDFVDIRFKYTFGQDMIVMAHKQVYDINRNVLKLAVNEKDILSYTSMTKDKALYVGCRTAAVQYAEGAIQEAAMNYYPLRLEVAATMLQDPNIKNNDDITQFNIVDRKLLEQQLISQADVDFSNLDDQNKTNEQKIRNVYADIIAGGETEMNKTYQAALDYYNEIQGIKAAGSNYGDTDEDEEDQGFAEGTYIG